MPPPRALPPELDGMLESCTPETVELVRRVVAAALTRWSVRRWIDVPPYWRQFVVARLATICFDSRTHMRRESAYALGRVLQLQEDWITREELGLPPLPPAD